MGEEWAPLMHRALDVAIRRDLHAQVGRAYANFTGLLQCDGRYDEALEAAREGLDYSEEHDVGTYSRCIRGGYAEVLELVGRWNDADAVLGDLLGMASSPENRIQGLLTAGRLAARRGDERTARGHLEEALGSALGTGESQFIVPTRVAWAELCWLTGDQSSAEEHLGHAVDLAPVMDAVTRAEVAAWSRLLGAPVDLGEVGTGPWATQLADPVAAVDRWLALDCPYPAALAALGAGDEASLLRALTLLDRLGATATARLVRRRLRESGARSVPSGARSTTRANPHGLTAREQEVLDRIAAGMGNADIAADLVISPKTVERHVSAVLAKLGVPDRRRAAELVAGTTPTEVRVPAS
jgi:ATP/maltotriose-dependent transcriptional regulator MalT